MTLSSLRGAIAEPHEDTTRRWAVVEIRADGTLGVAELVTAAAAGDAVRRSRTARPADRTLEHPVLCSRVGLLQAARGHLGEAARSFSRGVRGAPNSPGPDSCLGQLALVEAVQGELRRARDHADLALSEGGATEDTRHARLARAWVHVERLEHDECARLLDLLEPVVDEQREPWLGTARALLRARLLVATEQPDAAVRLLATATDGAPGARSPWADGVLAVAHAEALLAAEEPQRALAVLTPPPGQAAAEGAVATARCRQAIGDVRGADAVLAGVGGALERAPLGLQVGAWLVEARLAAERGPARSRSLIHRALRAAEAEDLRAPVQEVWCWLRPLVQRDPALLRTHRRFLATFREAHVAPHRAHPPGPHRLSDGFPSERLTEREAQVLELVAQMYSTAEIADALYVSSNTVKTHLKGIFAKLGVNRRVDAVRRGRQLGLC